MFTYERTENQVLILFDGSPYLIFTRYPCGIDWTEEQAESWAIAKVAFLQNPENNLEPSDFPEGYVPEIFED